MNSLITKATNLAVGITVMMAMTTANAFTTDTSQQVTVWIGKGGAENMQAVQAVKVQELQTAQTTQPTQSHLQQYQQQSSDSQSISLKTTVTTTIQPTQSYAQNYQYNQPSYNNQAVGNEFERLVTSTDSAAVAVFDMATGRAIYEKNVDVTRSIASISKLMTAMVILDSGQDLRDELVISASNLQGSGGKNSSTRLKLGDRLSRSQFLLMMLMKSENPAAKTLASHYYAGYDAFIAAMNQKAQSLGMYNTRFSDPTGLHPRNVSTASDLVKMVREISTNPRYQTIRNFSTAPSYDFYITNYSSGNRTYKATNTSRLVRSGNYPIGVSKTGYIREAGHCVVMETHVNGRPAIVVLLGARNSDKRWNDAESILGQLAFLN